LAVEFSYVRAGQVSEALELLNQPGYTSRPLAGNTDLMLLLRNQPDLCDRVVDITHISELHRITNEGSTVTIGAAATFTEILSNPIIQATAPLLVQACSTIGGVQIRNIATIGGNVANAAACADSLPALVCLDAMARVLTPGHEFTCPVAELVLKPNQTIIPPGGLLESLSFSVPASGSRSYFNKLGRRKAMAISRLTVAVLGRVNENGTIVETRIVTGSATPRISRLAHAEAVLLGQKPSQALFGAAGRAVADEMIRLSGRRWSSEFKEPAVIAMTTHALAQIFDVRETA
jgi:CO/xanthine dehydrogenase FAD-binding subunit